MGIRKAYPLLRFKGGIKMNKKLTVSLAAAIIALTAIFAGGQTIKSLNNETTLLSIRIR